MSYLKSPENYNEMLSRLGISTMLTTFIYTLFLSNYGLLPKTTIDSIRALAPPVKDQESVIQWLFSFGTLPIMITILAGAASYYFGLHNIIAKAIGLRFYWDKYLVLQPMLKRARIDKKLTNQEVESAMNNFYYPNVSKIQDKHYIHIFWRYALAFWALFEHFWIALIMTIVLSIKYSNPNQKYLWLHLLIILLFTTTQWFFVTTQKSKAIALQIPIKDIDEYFKSKVTV